MMFLRHHRLATFAALTAYLVVNLGAGALHHHHGSAARPAEVPTARGPDLQFLAAGQADDDEEETCLLCSVLHLAQASPSTVHGEALVAPTGEAFSAAALLEPHLLAAPAHARSPPLM